MSLVTFGELTFDLQRKPIKNLHISVLPPDGRVRVSAPVSLSNTAIRMAVVGLDSTAASTISGSASPE